MNKRLYRAAIALGASVGSAATIVSLAGPSAAVTATPDHLVCTDTQTYSITSHSANHLKQTVATVQLLNNAKTTATLSTNLTITGTVSMSVSGSLSVDEGIILASVKETITAQATKTLSVSQTVGASMTVRPGKVGYIEGGIFRVETAGSYEHVDINCNTTKGTETALTPYHYGYITSGG